ncbi:hypothetical protein SEA_RASPUTIA_29 [Microbacterium phage Rasputia]|nr:hypothetical protein SEA_RASPUTIA_29 [Microbacterium phage Rasputia]
MMDDARDRLREHLRARPAGPTHLEVDTALAELAKVDGDLKQLAPVHVHVLVRAVDELKLVHLREQEDPDVRETRAWVEEGRLNDAAGRRTY